MSRLEDKGAYSELEAARMIHKIIEGLNHIHSVHVVHRDLKPDNIIVDDNGDPKIIDFGLSTDTLGGTKRLKTYVGSKVYMAPEILENTGHTSTCDMWSIGIILYLLLSGSFPFSLRNIEHEISNSPVCFPPHKWDKISISCKHFILKLLDKCRESRIQPAAALKHPWFEILDKDEELHCETPSPGLARRARLIDKDLLLKLKKYRGVSKLKTAALSILVKTMSPQEIEPLKQLFQSIDKDKTGFIHVSELKDALEASGHSLTDEEIDNIIKEIDVAKNGKINYSEFLAATIDVKSLVSEQKLWMIFKRFDVDNTDYISKENIIKAMKKLGKAINMDEVNETFNTHDHNNDGGINFEEFCKIFHLEEIDVPEDFDISPMPQMELLSPDSFDSAGGLKENQQ